MSVKTTVSAGALSLNHLLKGIETFLKDSLMNQGLAKEGMTIQVSRGPGRVKMHGSERAEANAAVVTFSDSPYNIGIQNNSGEISFVFDSWVDGGLLRNRVDGKGERGSGANLSQCEMLERSKAYAESEGRSFGVEFLKDGCAKAFISHV